MWDPPRPGLEPVSPASAGRPSTTAPPGKPWNVFIYYFDKNLDHPGLLFCLFSEPYWTLLLTGFTWANFPKKICEISELRQRHFLWTINQLCLMKNATEYLVEWDCQLDYSSWYDWKDLWGQALFALVKTQRDSGTPLWSCWTSFCVSVSSFIKWVQKYKIHCFNLLI